MSELFEYKCPACGGTLEFDSALQKLKCPFCESTYTVEEMSSRDAELDKAPHKTENSNWNTSDTAWSAGETDGMVIFLCNSCGGEIIGDQVTGAGECPFCGNQVVMKGAFSGDLKPDYVIPFKLDKKAAKAKYAQHISGKYLLPKEFRTQNHIDEIKGVYVPFWLYDADVHSAVKYRAGRVRHWSDNKYNYTETSLYEIFREGSMQFQHIPCDGSSKMDDDLMESIEPFDFSDAVPFRTAYLAGYFADKYDVDRFENLKRAEERIENSALQILRDTVDPLYSAVNAVESHTNRTGGKIHYALYPVWLLTSTYKGEKYTFAMNGQTGKFVGNLPVNKNKQFLTALGTFAASSVVISLILHLLGG